MKNVKRSSFWAMFLLALCSGATAHAQITPSGDAFINTASPTKNFGTSTLLDVESASQNTYIQFDLSSLPSGYAGANISKATLKRYVNANWSLDAVPGQGNDCVLPTNSVVTSHLAGVYANFTLATGGSLTVTLSYLFVYGSSFTNQSAISVGAGNSVDFAQPLVNATISGHGTITLTAANAAFSGGQNRVINSDNTIQGQGFIGSNKFWRKVCIS